jgi:outer membrane protein OmpA-like peptidoglycan-associated protein
MTIISLVMALQASGQNDVSDYLLLSGIESAEAYRLDSINSDQLEFAPAGFRDGLLFVSANSGKKRIRTNEKIRFQLMFARGSLEKGFSRPVVFDSISSSAALDGPVSFDADRQLLIATKTQNTAFEKEEESEMKLGLFFYHFDGQSWILQSAFPFNNRQYNVCHPAWDPAGQRLYFASDMPGGFGGLDLYVVTRQPDGTWSSPVNLGIAVNSEGNDCFPFVFERDFLFFSTDRETTLGGFDVQVSVLREGIWLESRILPEPVNSPYDDLGLYLAPDGRQLYFTSSRPGGAGKDDVWGIMLDHSLTDVPPARHTIQVVREDNQLPLPGAMLTFFRYRTSDAFVQRTHDRFSNILFTLDPESVERLDSVRTGSDGRIQIALDPGDYILQTEKADYRIKQQWVEIEDQTKSITVSLDSIRCKQVSILVADSVTGDRLSGVRVTSGDRQWNTDAEGKISPCVYRENPTDLMLTRDNYQDFALRLDFTELDDGEEIVVSLRPEQLYTPDLPVFSGEFTVLEDILYAYDKAELNKRAMLELDRLAEHMIRYPSIRIELSAHTDSRGGEVYNQLLSEQRAKVARDYLVEKGVEEWRIAATGYGESRLVNHCSNGVPCSEQEHAVNRRTEVRVLTGTE